MKPGRELDALVAKKVLGLSVFIGLYQSDRDYRGQWDEDLLYSPYTDNPTYQIPVPHYSTDIAAAWEVVEKLKALNENGDFHLEHLWGFWRVSTCNSPSGWSAWTRGQTAPHAICLAALKAVGHEA